jgi:hypothetical protein
MVNEGLTRTEICEFLILASGRYVFRQGPPHGRARLHGFLTRTNQDVLTTDIFSADIPTSPALTRRGFSLLDAAPAFTMG